MSEFKISRLRFSWAGEWADATVYNKDEVVQFEGKAYVCLIPHTSSGFYNDLNDIFPKWELMMTGQTWKGPWTQFGVYSLDNIVVFGGVVYKCNEAHSAGAFFDTDIDKWDTYAESKTWASEWVSSYQYGIGDIVRYGGSTYECKVSHTSAATDLLGLEDDYTQVDDSTEVYWKLLQFGVQYRGEYNTSTQDSTQSRYKLNDLVKYGPSIYECIRGHAPSIPEVVDFGVYTSTIISPFGGAIVYTVTVAAGVNEYGAGNKYYFAGESGASPALSLTRGLTYRFDQSDPSNATHQLLFSATPNGAWNGGGIEYTTGVLKVGTAGTDGAYTQITIPDDAPALYYYCINHSGMGGTIIPPGVSTFVVTPVANTVNEGSTLTINVTTQNVDDNSNLYWSLTNAADFSVTSGSFTITGNSGSFTVNPDADVLTEGAQTFVVQIRTESVSGTIVGTSSAITINDTSQAPPASYTTSASANNIDEGSPLTVTVTTSNVADATTLYWTATNSTDFGTSSGSFTITSNTGSFTVTPTADTATEGEETFDVEIRIGSIVGTIVDTLTSITINDTSQGVSITADYTITVTNVGSSAYTMSGTDQNGSVSGDNVGLTFSQGDVVDFVVNASGHPFYIKTQQTIGIGDQASGVTNGGADSGTVQWTVSNSGTYYYICEFHSSMYGEITV
tara:strand:+ start:4089 stop:6116 length:2028 start_codon:yes stop_codon:yes gene_type:complete